MVLLWTWGQGRGQAFLYYTAINIESDDSIVTELFGLDTAAVE